MENKELTSEQKTEILSFLKARFEKNINRHPNLVWDIIQEKLQENPLKLWSLLEMERTGGEPDVVAMGENSDTIIFVDCSSETPKKRRSICYDQEALDSRKEFKPANSAVNMASEMGIELLNEQQYRTLQTFGNFDVKTSSWIKTPDEIRKLGGALFCDRRYNHVFTYHNGAESYYAVRGFRGLIRV
jgi:hypothetical protein